MTLSLQDKLALIYTSAGSQRGIAAMVGISHQKVGRLLKPPELGGVKPTSRVLRDPLLIAQIDAAMLVVHTARTIERAKADGIPYRSALPVYMERMPRTVKEWVDVVDRKTDEIERKFLVKKIKGKPVMERGDRIAAQHTHWLSDKLRNKWIAAMYETRKFVNASVGSVVNLALYNKQAEQRSKEPGFYKSPSNRASRTEIKRMRNKKPPIDRQLIQTPYVSMLPGQYTDLVIENIQDHLSRKHQPATGDIDTSYATRVLFQTPELSKSQRSLERPIHEKAKPGSARPTRSGIKRTR